MAWFVSIVTALVVLCAMPAQAQNYPAKPIHVLVPYAPGGIADIASRIVGAKLTEAWGQQVVVENKPGGNGFIAMTAAAKAAPDGYTLVMATVGDVAINPAMFKEMPYDVAARLCADRRGQRRAAGARGARRRALQDRCRRHRRRQGAAGAALGRHARQRQHQPDRPGVDGAQHRHQVPAHPLQGRRAGLRPRLPAATCRSGFWRARRWRRTSSPAASACWR